MPKRTYIAQEEKSAPGFKPAKDRITLLFGGNASGDLKLKPIAVYHCETPRAMIGSDGSTKFQQLLHGLVFECILVSPVWRQRYSCHYHSNTPQEFLAVVRNEITPTGMNPCPTWPHRPHRPVPYR
ncbi:hypothetical protein M514_25641 [Trichuris suis]|uniref:DDE-1 domain-containing protein n=1 Tax=Trichuris suis TaxID=68888 RepID=A0A085MY60_9BILA|nr:hypothetical protein M514_25641 [Trichuris suis]